MRLLATPWSCLARVMVKKLKRDILILWKSSKAEETIINADVSLCMKSSVVFMFLFTPRATRYAELGGSWNSDVNKGNRARQRSVLFEFLA